MKAPSLTDIYTELHKLYGCQGWWPISGKYHKGDYEAPKRQ